MTQKEIKEKLEKAGKNLEEIEKALKRIENILNNLQPKLELNKPSSTSSGWKGC